MKKLITLSAIIALSMTTISHAKGGRSFGGSRALTSKPVMTQQQTSSYAKQKDATFENTPNRTAPTQSASGSRLANFATGAAAGYVLSEMLTPSQAHAQTTQPSTTTSETQQSAISPTPANNVAEFKSIGGQVDPYLIEKTDGYRRYCIAGVQYLASAMSSQTTPIVMVNPNGTPLACNLVQ